MSIYIPISLNLIVITYLQHNIIYITNKQFLMYTNYKLSFTYFDPTTTSFSTIFNYINLFSKLFANHITDHNKMLIAWNKIYIKKIKFKGKGYKFTKQKNQLSLFFNHSHITETLFVNTFFYRQRKFKFLLLNKNQTTLMQIVTKILSTRIINKYTKRGLRTSRMCLYKRKGKTNITVK